MKILKLDPFYYALVIIALLHFWFRFEFQKTFTLKDYHFYSQEHIVSLNILAGNGLSKPKLPINSSHNPEYQSILKFLRLEQNDLADDVLKNLKSFPLEKISQYHRNRIFDYIIAAIIWWIFGISWTHLVLFYIFVSTLANVCFTYIIKKITGSTVSASIAGLLIALSQNEIVLSVWSYRDCNPAWFFSFALFAIAIFFTSKNKKRKNLLLFCIGIVSAIGYGWRSDNLLIILFSVIVVAILISISTNSIWKKTSAFLSFFMGCLAVYAALEISCQKQEKLSNGYFFHISNYSENARCDILEIANKFELFFSDESVIQNVYSKTKEQPAYLSESYSHICYKILNDTLKLNFESYLKKIPKYILVSYPRNEALTYFGNITKRFCKVQTEILEITNLIKNPLLIISPIIFFLAIWNTILLKNRTNKIIASSCLLFYLSYSLIYLFVLPQIKHYALGTQGFGLLLSVACSFKTCSFEQGLKNIKNILLSLICFGLIYSVLLINADDSKTIIRFIQRNTKKIEKITINNKKFPLRFFPKTRDNSGTKSMISIFFKTADTDKGKIVFQIERPFYKIQKTFNLAANSEYIFYFCLSPSILPFTEEKRTQKNFSDSKLKKLFDNSAIYTVSFEPNVIIYEAKNMLIPLETTDISVLYKKTNQKNSQDKYSIINEKVLIERIL